MNLNEQIELYQFSQSVAKIASWRHELKSNLCWFTDEYKAILELESMDNPFHFNFLLDLVDKKDRSEVLTKIEQSYQNTDIHILQFRLETGNGKLKYIEMHWRNIQDPDGKVLFSVGRIQDISHRVSQELKNEELLKTNQLLELAMERNGYAYWDMDF